MARFMDARTSNNLCYVCELRQAFISRCRFDIEQLLFSGPFSAQRA